MEKIVGGNRNCEETIVINGRFRAHRVTGVQRYAHEICNRLSAETKGLGLQSKIDVLSPTAAKGARGHLWEQTVLPLACAGRLLWSPCGTGPVCYSRQVVTYHDLFPLEHPEWYGTAYAAWYRLSMKYVAARSLHMIAVSHYTKSRIVSLLGCDPDTITVVPNGLTTGCERTSQEKTDAARMVLKIPTKRYLLSLSSLEKRKNLKTTLQAWAEVRSSLPGDVWLVLAGPAADEKVYGEQDLPIDVPNVLFTGYVPEEHLAGLYSGASLFLFPSLAEGFGIPLLEAMACGLRCITSNTTSLPEVGGDVVTYVDPLDVSALAEAIRTEIASGAGPAEPFLPAIERARNFSWDRSASDTLAVLEAAVELKRNSRVEVTI